MARDVERIERIMEALRESTLDGLVCALPANILLITGYWPVVGTAVALFRRDGHTVIVAPEDEGELARCAGADEVRTFEAGSLVTLDSTLDAIAATFHYVFRDLGLDRGVVGCETGEAFEPASYASMHLYGPDIVRLVMDSLSTGSVLPAGSVLARLRAVATPMELDRIRRACRIASHAFVEGCAGLVHGLKETEAAALFRAPLSTVGTGFEGVQRADGFVYCMSGPNAARAYGAYARSRARHLRQNDLVLAHCNSYADGYWTDITRTFSLGTPDDRGLRMYQAVRAARDAALAAICPGVRARDVDRAARETLRQHGYEFKHATGHGVGFAAIDHQARPRLHPQSDDVIEAGMIFNVGPAVYEEGYGAVRHCDTVAVTDSGIELLTPVLTDMDALVR